jgi:hypothetical protein
MLTLFAVVFAPASLTVVLSDGVGFTVVFAPASLAVVLSDGVGFAVVSTFIMLDMYASDV